jgi:hypothetical protein
VRAEGAEGERVRIQAVREQAMPGHEQLIEKLAADGKTSGPDAAVQVLAAERTRVTSIANARAEDAPAPVPTSTEKTEEPEAQAPTMRAPSGYAIDPASAKIDADAKAFMAAHAGVDYLAAVRAVSK